MTGMSAEEVKPLASLIERAVEKFVSSLKVEGGGA